MNDDILTIKEAAAYLKLSETTVWKFIREAEIEVTKFPDSKKTYIAASEITNFINRKRTGKTAPSLDEILNVAVRAPKSGCYFLIDKNEIVYIGKSRNVFARIGRHMQEGTKKFTKYAIIDTPETDTKNFESNLIARFRPKYNISENK